MSGKKEDSPNPSQPVAKSKTKDEQSVSKSASKVDWQNEFSYLPPPEPFYAQQGLREKLVSKTKENPFVPLGVVFTTVVLVWGLSTLKTGNVRKTQVLMRARVGGQAFAVLAMLAGVYYNQKKQRDG